MPTPRDLRSTKSERWRVPADDLDNEAVIARYLAARVNLGRRWRPETRRVRALQLARIAADLAPAVFLTATEDDLYLWHSRLTGTPETVASYTSAARGLFRWMAVSARPRLRETDPTIALERPRIPEAQPRPMLDRHYDLALACAVSSPEMYLWLGLMGCSGLRCCEIAWMTTGDVEQLDSGAGLLHIVGKGGKRRTVPAGAMLMLTMRPFLVGRGPVFTRPSDGRAYTPHNVSRRVNRFLAGVGIPAPSTAHSLRHRFGTDYHALDPDLYRQAKLMGHASVDTTQRYTAISPVEAAEYIEQLTTRRLTTPARQPGSSGRRIA